LIPGSFTSSEDSLPNDKSVNDTTDISQPESSENKVVKQQGVADRKPILKIKFTAKPPKPEDNTESLQHGSLLQQQSQTLQHSLSSEVFTLFKTVSSL
jgi:hypothetical protein